MEDIIAKPTDLSASRGSRQQSIKADDHTNSTENTRPT